MSSPDSQLCNTSIHLCATATKEASALLYFLNARSMSTSVPEVVGGFPDQHPKKMYYMSDGCAEQ